MSFNGWMDNENVIIHTVKFYLAVKQREIVKMSGN